MNFENKIFKMFGYYLLLVSILMIAQFLYYDIQLLVNGNINAWMAEKQPWFSNNFYQVLGYLFFFCVYNIPICIISGLVFLIKGSHVRLAILCLIGGGLHYLLLRQVGDSL